MRCYLKMSIEGRIESVSELTVTVTATYAAGARLELARLFGQRILRAWSLFLSVTTCHSAPLSVNVFNTFVEFVKFRVTLNSAEWHCVLCPECALSFSRRLSDSGLLSSASSLILLRSSAVGFLIALAVSWVLELRI